MAVLNDYVRAVYVLVLIYVFNLALTYVCNTCVPDLTVWAQCTFV